VPVTRRAPQSNPAIEFRRHRSREWHIQFQLPWEVWVKDERVARFKHERDACGFARARYGTAAEVINLQQEPGEEG
jgi:hypothetical protein